MTWAIPVFLISWSYQFDLYYVSMSNTCYVVENCFIVGIKADPDADIVPRTIMIGGKVCPHQLVCVWRLSSNLMNKKIGENKKM